MLQKLVVRSKHKGQVCKSAKDGRGLGSRTQNCHKVLHIVALPRLVDTLDGPHVAYGRLDDLVLERSRL